jgi:AraC-like DNA-binding protein
VKIGRWRLPAAHPLFEDSGPTRHYLFVFPRTSTWIQHAGEAPFVADANTVTYYNAGQEYTRRRIAGVGDRCEYYAVSPAVLREAVREFDPGAADDPSRILRISHGPSDAPAYLAQRRVYAHVRQTSSPDPLFVEESLLGILDRVLRLAYRVPHAATSRQRELVQHAREQIARRFTARLHLADLARETGTSVFHLCRTFRATTGTTLHAYRNQLRLRAALAPVIESDAEFSEIALELGYSTHSHFTAAFHAAFGVTPSMLRASTSRRRLPSTSFRRRSIAPTTDAPGRLRDATT